MGALPLLGVLALGMGRQTLGEEIGSSQVWSEGGRLEGPQGDDHGAKRIFFVVECVRVCGGLGVLCWRCSQLAFR